ncbi:hypothetical protein AMECASPLE_019507 [Ameca splendens]|uniref:Uncharacterized protein n=1 Tax=Ameca splendens TaxID=208324 RepID=A0ABV0YQL5_9TELE
MHPKDEGQWHSRTRVAEPVLEGKSTKKSCYTWVALMFRPLNILKHLLIQVFSGRSPSLPCKGAPHQTERTSLVQHKIIEGQPIVGATEGDRDMSHIESVLFCAEFLAFHLS